MTLSFLRRAAVVAVMAGAVSMAVGAADYTPTEENLKSRQEFADAGLGIFLHWGIYSMFGQGEWYLNSGVNAEEYAKAARGFYPAYFDAKEWVSAIKASGAKYICITSRHHDGFSMWGTKQSSYNIVDGTPFRRDVLKELADECERQGIRLHFYYSHLDWTRPDYPQGRTGHDTGRQAAPDWESYKAFMNAQLTELLTGYGKVGAIWFDGYWDHDEDPTPFDWQLEEQYALIHRLQPGCLVGNNHHVAVIPGEDIQIFERDVPGENEAGLSGQDVSRLPLETCQTMNGMWGYKVKDQDYKTTDELVRYLVRTAGKGANLLLNIGPQPSGELPAAAIDRLKGIGKWMDSYGETIYATTGSPLEEEPEWGTLTVKRADGRVFLHVLSEDASSVSLPFGSKVKKAVDFISRKPVKVSGKPGAYTIHLDGVTAGPDRVVELLL